MMFWIGIGIGAVGGALCGAFIYMLIIHFSVLRYIDVVQSSRGRKPHV